MNEQSGESKDEKVMGKGIGESEMEELVPEWGWRSDKVSWFERQDEAYRNERSVICREDDVGGWARVTMDEEYCEDGEQRWGYEGTEVG